MSVSLCPTLGAFYQGFSNGGLPLNAGYVYTYIAGGTTPQATYTTSAGNVANANPIVLDSAGRPPSEVWLLDGVTYRFDLYDSLGNLIKTYDNVYGIQQPLSGSTGAGAVGYIADATGAVATNLLVKGRETKSVLDFGAFGAGADETVPLQTAFTWWQSAPFRSLDFDKGRKYIAEAPRITLTGASFSSIFFNGATIIAKNGRAVAASTQILYMTSCTDIDVHDGTVDGNRANRTPSESSSHCIEISTSCARIRFFNMAAINSTTDGFIVNSETSQTLGTIPTDIQFFDCRGDNAYRNDLSLINSVRFRDHDGRYTSANGVAPQAGVDCEPDAYAAAQIIAGVSWTIKSVGTTNFIAIGAASNNVGITFIASDAGTGTGTAVISTAGNIDAQFFNTECSRNTGQGFNNSNSNSAVSIFNMVANANGDGGVQNAGASMTLDGLSASGYTSTVDAGVVTSTIDAGVSIFKNMTFRDVVFNAANKALVVTGGANGGDLVQHVEGIDAHGVQAAILFAVNRINASEINVTSINQSAEVAITLNQARSSLRGVNIYSTSSSLNQNRWIQVVGNDCVVESVVLQNPGATSGGTMGAIEFAAGALRGTARNISVYQDATIPTGQRAVKFFEIPLAVENLTAKCLGADYTTTNVLECVAGSTGSTLTNITPNPLVTSVTWNPASIADNTSLAHGGATVPGAVMGEKAAASFTNSLQGMTISAYVSAADTIVAVISNLTGGAIDLASGTLSVWVIKS